MSNTSSCFFDNKALTMAYRHAVPLLFAFLSFLVSRLLSPLRLEGFLKVFTASMTHSSGVTMHR